MFEMKFYLLHLILACVTIHSCSAIWCYRCTSATPGCAENFNWRGIGYMGEQCPEENDICMKIVEKKGAKQTIIRDCLSALRGHRRDIPPDHYEGCRPASNDLLLAHYVNATIKEWDVHRDYFDSVTFCFCFLDHRCNSAVSMKVTSILVPVTLMSIFFSFYKFMTM